MRILFFSTYYLPYLSGLTTYPGKILTYLSNKHSVTIATFRYSDRLPQYSRDGNMTVCRMPYLFRISKGFISPQAWLAFIKYARKTDIVILNIPNFEGLPLALVAGILQKPVISIFHCQVDLGGSFFNRIAAAFLNFSVYLQLRFSTTIVINTRDYFEHLPRENHFSRKTRVILPSVTQPEVNRQKLVGFLKQKEDYAWIGFSGRISREKGIHHLIHAIEQLSGQKKIKLIMAGPYGHDVTGEYTYYSFIQSLLERTKIKYQLLGKLSGGDLGAFYQAIDVLVLPSVNRTEAFGLVQIEAMLSGKPVIASNLPGVRIPVTLTGMGLLVEPGDQDGLSRAINKVIEKPSEFSNSRLKTRALNFFSEQTTYDAYDQLLANIADESQ
jgi:glycosyltransferase involved in cell wall biosynthesis